MFNYHKVQMQDFQRQKLLKFGEVETSTSTGRR
jgi:hypothetical protein